MAANKLFIGNGPFDLAAPYALTSGQGAQIGAALFGVALTSVASGVVVALDIEGVFDLTKEPALAITQGARVFWDNPNRRVTTVATSNLAIGIAYAGQEAAFEVITLDAAVFAAAEEEDAATEIVAAGMVAKSLGKSAGSSFFAISTPPFLWSVALSPTEPT